MRSVQAHSTTSPFWVVTASHLGYTTVEFGFFKQFWFLSHMTNSPFSPRQEPALKRRRDFIRRLAGVFALAGAGGCCCKPALESDRKLARNQSVREIQSNGQVALARTGGLFHPPITIHLNESAAFVWHQLQQPASAAELASRMLSAYRGDGREIARDCRSFLEQLYRHGMLV